MKLRFYVDLWPGLNPLHHNCMASTQPGVKNEGCKRVAFDVAIPDSVLFDIDAVSLEVSKVEKVEDHDS